MIKNINPSQCCGCTACASICTHEAITMQPDVFGFLYPVVDESKCTNCGLCGKVCAFHSGYNKELNLPEPLAFAARHKDMNQIAASQSGAAFAALSDWILEQGGVIYGVGYEWHFRVAHKRAVTKEQRDEFRGSKYVQSDLNTVFKQVKKDLKDGLIVMFSGTPCQTAGLTSFIGKALRENLFVMDIVCHGVPAPYVWKDYIDYLERKEGGIIIGVNFRDKKLKGWHSHVESFCFDNDNTIHTYTYTYIFYKHIMFRHSCGECPYTNLKRPSDVTVADFWGIEKTSAAYLGEDNKGCSLMLINTEKGKAWFEQIKDRMNVHQVSPKECLQPNLQQPSQMHPKRNEFENYYQRYGFEKTMKKFGLMGWRKVLNDYNQAVKYKIKSVIQRFFI